MLLAVTRCYRYLPKKEGLSDADYSKTRTTVNQQLINGYFGPAKGGVYSISLQVRFTQRVGGCLSFSQLPHHTSAVPLTLHSASSLSATHRLETAPHHPSSPRNGASSPYHLETAPRRRPSTTSVVSC